MDMIHQDRIGIGIGMIHSDHIGIVIGMVVSVEPYQVHEYLYSKHYNKI